MMFKKNATGIERCRKIKTLPDLDKYIIFSFACLIVFTITEIIVQAVTGVSQDTLITCFFAAFGGELLCCAMIKRLKLKMGEHDNG